MSKHTPGPWSWNGEDYRFGWGWQLLVGPSGDGILCGQKDDGPYDHLLANLPIPAEFCKTGFYADERSAPCVHVMEADAHLIAAAPDLLEALEELMADLEANHVNGYRTEERLNAARAAIAKAKGESK